MEDYRIFDASNPRHVYKSILATVENIVQSINMYSTHEGVEKARVDALVKITALQKKLSSSVSQLEKNAEWNRFTIAFYGETNSGKSTLIETLRILLHESEKMKERCRFNEIHDEYVKLDKQIKLNQSAVKNIASNYEEKLTESQLQLQELSEKLGVLEEKIDYTKDQIETLIIMIKKERKTSLLNLVRFIFRRLPEQAELKELKASLFNIEGERSGTAKKHSELLHQIGELERDLAFETEPLNKAIAELQERVVVCEECLSQFVDGKIIGDGRSDFTRAVQSYHFQVDNREFTLLDVPGIEGTEYEVIDDINAAIQKSHVVFYVTSQPRPPQSGDKNSKGMLDKVKEHLGQQTEVYAIYNKRANNPSQLQEPIINDDEAKGLSNMDDILQKHLGEQYGGNLALSAYPAFLAVGNCWQTEHMSKKTKFEKFFGSTDAILHKSGMQEFSKRLTEDIIDNYKTKIKKSNLKKLTFTLEHTIDEISYLCKDYCDLEQKLKTEARNTAKKLDEAVGQLKSGLERELHTSVETYKRQTRKIVYLAIDEDIDNTQFKSMLKKEAEDGLEKLQNLLEKSFQSQKSQFQDNITKIIDKYNEHTLELLELYIRADNFDDKLDD